MSAEGLPWTHRQRVGLGMLLALLIGALAVRCWKNPIYISNPPAEGDRAGELARRIDPNTAEWSMLAALPGLGKAVAQEIVAYREAWAARHPGEAAFAKLDDLDRVKGIGPATLATLESHLSFPTTRATSRAVSLPPMGGDAQR